MHIHTSLQAYIHTSIPTHIQTCREVSQIDGPSGQLIWMMGESFTPITTVFVDTPAFKKLSDPEHTMPIPRHETPSPIGAQRKQPSMADRATKTSPKRPVLASAS